MDTMALRNMVFQKTGIRIDESDPVFAIVALNEAVLSELMMGYQLILSKNNDELAEMVANLLVVHKNIVEASRELVERANQAHITAALKAAAEARGEIMKAAQVAITAQLEKPIPKEKTDALNQSEGNWKPSRNFQWWPGVMQALIGGCVGGVIVAASPHFMK